jgi:Domain of unknown function (DUF3846)
MMSRASYSQLATATPIRALIIQPDNTYEVRETGQDIATLRRLVGGQAEAFSTEHCTFWYNTVQVAGMPLNSMATYLWWITCPAMEGRAALSGTVFVTGAADETGDSLPLSGQVVDLFENMVKIVRETDEQA